MKLIRVVAAGIAHPFGDERTVTQAFPQGVSTKECDPFLMCDFYTFHSEGPSKDPDAFPIDWHPHRGFDILSYLKTGVGRHGDSLGNRETYATPGMQWMSVGSGVYHAEGGGTPKGQTDTGFQIWVNVPSTRKMDKPRYGTVPPEAMPQVQVSKGVKARLIAGPFGGRKGEFDTTQSVQMIDFELEAGATLEHTVPAHMDTVMLFVYKGAGEVAGARVSPKHVALLDASDASRRAFRLRALGGACEVLLFAGKKLREPIAWHGPIVMNTQQQILQTFKELRSDRFPPHRVPWDYKRLAAFPADKKGSAKDKTEL